MLRTICHQPCRERPLEPEEDGLILSAVEGNDILAGLKVADRAFAGALLVTALPTWWATGNLNFTNVCIVGCAFCGFSRGRKFTRRLFSASTDSLIAKSDRGGRAGCNGGLHSGRAAQRPQGQLLCRSSPRHPVAPARTPPARVFAHGNHVRRRKEQDCCPCSSI